MRENTQGMLWTIYHDFRRFYMKYSLVFTFPMNSYKSLPKNFQVLCPNIASHSSTEYTISWKILILLETAEKGLKVFTNMFGKYEVGIYLFPNV